MNVGTGSCSGFRISANEQCQLTDVANDHRGTHLCQTEIDKDTFSTLVVPKEIGWLDVSVQDASFVRVVQSPEQTTEIFPNVRWVDILVKQLATKIKKFSESFASYDEVTDSRGNRHFGDMALQRRSGPPIGRQRSTVRCFDNL